MERSRFDEYIARFNAEDATAFDEFIAPDMQMTNGTLEFTGVEGMKAHYARIWGTFRETLTIGRYLTDDNHIAIEMHTLFTALKDEPDSTFGPVVAGETFVFQGLIMYDVVDGKFTKIRVAYNSFTNTKPDGTVRELGIPH